VKRGSTFTLPCYTKDNYAQWYYRRGRDDVHWIYFNGSMVNNQSRFSVPKLNGGDFSLSVNDAQLDDSGFYICTERSSKSSNKHEVQVITSCKFLFVSVFLCVK